MAIRKSSNSGIPFGNTASRPASPAVGQPYFNGEVGRLELYSSNGWQNIVQETPGVASASGTYNQSAGSGTFTLSGTNFVDGAIAYAVGTNGVEYQATTTTYNSIVQITTVFSNLSPAYEPYDIKVTNPSNLFGLLPDAFYIDDNPVWSTTAGSLGNYTGSSIQLAATDDESSTITYSVTSGSLPTGLSMSSSGLISGTATSTGTFTFTVSASDGTNTAVTRSFSLVVPVSVTGGSISISGDYRVHTFTSSGVFATNLSSLNVDYLVVAGGGGGGATYGGGGGGGGLRSTVTATGGGASLESQLTLAASNNYTVTVGAGGASGLAGYNPTNAPAFSGTNSVFSTITATGGGGGGGGGGSAKNGGSGGGGMDSITPGSGTSGQGYAGGGSSSGGVYGAGGGGGAGSVGSAGNSGAGGNGGSGVAVAIIGSSTTYAGGGGGGTYQGGTSGNGGSGGGGNAATSGVGNASSLGTAGTANTGGGGGGGSALQSTNQYLGVGGSGGSGIVIVRYLKSAVGL
jgi:hypothetical protein